MRAISLPQRSGIPREIEVISFIYAGKSPISALKPMARNMPRT